MDLVHYAPVFTSMLPFTSAITALSGLVTAGVSAVQLTQHLGQYIRHPHSTNLIQELPFLWPAVTSVLTHLRMLNTLRLQPNRRITFGHNYYGGLTDHPELASYRKIINDIDPQFATVPMGTIQNEKYFGKTFNKFNEKDQSPFRDIQVAINLSNIDAEFVDPKWKQGFRLSTVLHEFAHVKQLNNFNTLRLRSEKAFRDAMQSSHSCKGHDEHFAEFHQSFYEHLQKTNQLTPELRKVTGYWNREYSEAGWQYYTIRI